MIKHLPVILIILPLLWSIINIILGQVAKKTAPILTAVMMAAVFGMSVIQMGIVAKGTDITYSLGNWEPPFGVELLVDPISGMVVCLIGLLGFMTTVYSYNIEKDSLALRQAGYYSLLSLLTAGMIGMTLTGDIFNFYVFLEITSLAAYGLVAMGRGKSGVSAFRYLVISTIGGSFYLIAVAFLYAETGSLNMKNISSILITMPDNAITVIAMGLLIIGFGVKMALFPLHGWQPAAYSNAHIGAAPMISGVMAKIPAYAMMNYFLIVFNGSRYVKEFIVIIGVLSAIGIIYGSLRAIQQKELARILAYSSIAQIGYIGLGMAIGNYYAIIGAILHIFYHSITKGGMYFAIGALEHKYGITKLNQLGNIYKKMSMTTILLIVGGISMIGLPPTVGFFSKWYLALGAIEDGLYIYVAVLVLSSLLNAIYFFRIIENIFTVDEDATPVVTEELDKEPKYISRRFVVISMAALILFSGLLNHYLVNILSETVRGLI